jgi:chaperone modulatory protein CbpM
MTDPRRPVSLAVLDAVVVEHEVRFSLHELVRAADADAAWLCALVEEGVLVPEGGSPDDWVFEGASLRRARLAMRLGRDFDLRPSDAALVLDLLDEIDALRRRLHAAGLR